MRVQKKRRRKETSCEEGGLPARKGETGSPLEAANKQTNAKLSQRFAERSAAALGWMGHGHGPWAMGHTGTLSLCAWEIVGLGKAHARDSPHVFQLHTLFLIFFIFIFIFIFYFILIFYSPPQSTDNQVLSITSYRSGPSNRSIQARISPSQKLSAAQLPKSIDCLHPMPASPRRHLEARAFFPYPPDPDHVIHSSPCC